MATLASNPKERKDLYAQEGVGLVKKQQKRPILPQIVGGLKEVAATPRLLFKKLTGK